MKIKSFLIGNTVFRFESESVIAGSEMYKTFITDSQNYDIRVHIIEGPLPDLKDAYYSSYTDGGKKIIYSCRVIKNNEIFLYINHPDGLWDSMVFNALNLSEILAGMNMFLFHSSFIIFNGSAIIFSGDKQVGKSTQALLWSEFADAEIINGDRSVLKTEGGKLTAYGTPYCGSSKIALQKSAPVRAIVMLSKSDENHLERLSPKDALVSLLSQMSFEKYQYEKAADFALEICRSVPVYSYSCRKDKTAVDFLREAL